MTQPGGAANWRTRARELSRKVPTKWFVTGVIAVFLSGSAAFGGLNTVEADALPQVAAATPYDGAELRISVERAVLVDGFPEQSINPAEGKRFFVVVATVENLWDRPVSTYSDSGAADNLRPVGIDGISADTKPVDVIVISDATRSPRLQPHVPIQLAYLWEVDPGVAAGMDEVKVDIYDKVYAAGGFVTFGARYDDPFLAATSTVPLKDNGAGASAETGASS
ncbi:hypothetical protein [Subtercola boreus]|uniref:DUF4352 domain-containing protein n=1 Tax=Subtercola boreus TaxID=120213 RepID=A0A3E0WAH8_9MICO|nr:hypothetical protein [Subtercola boreus]RFA21032.1 hypothetical protein B7R24_06385 [Subtercola boreus]RFA21416.1 hypothetical protein B7R23_06330 [Subtercola boreus]RFA27387.1 hypothetical protein B7R25_06455 [Subtercola boreus]